MTDIKSIYGDAAADRPFASFQEDMNDEMWSKQREFRHALITAYHENNNSDSEHHKKAAKYALRLYNVLMEGGVLRTEADRAPQWKFASTPALHWRDADENCGVGGYLGCWFDYDDRLFHVLEYNKVKGMVVRKYKIMTFLAKLERTYMLHGGAENPVTALDFQPYLDIIFPNMEGMQVEVWDTPSEMYDHRNITSCMVGEDYVKFYDTAPVKGLVVTLNGKLVARTLLWTADCGTRIIGRIYDSSGRAVRLIRTWCDENGVGHDDNAWNNADLKVTCPLKGWGVPYMDDFQYGVRIANDMVLFATLDSARRFERKNGKNVIDHAQHMQHTEGGPDCWREDVVQVSDGSYCLQEQVREFRGKTYNIDATPFPDVMGFNRLPVDTVVRNPNSRDQLITVGELQIINGDVADPAAFNTVDDGTQIRIRDTNFHLDVDADGNIFIASRKAGYSNPNDLLYYTVSGYILRQVMNKLLLPSEADRVILGRLTGTQAVKDKLHIMAGGY